MKKRKLLFKIIVLVLSIVCVGFSAVYGFFYFVLGTEWLFVKLEIDNPYVNNRYSGWKDVLVDELGSFSIPEEWSLSEADGIYTITDASGQVWAHGAVVGDKYSFSNYEEFVIKILPEAQDYFSLEPFERFIMMDGSYIYEMIICADRKSEGKRSQILQMFVDVDTDIAWILTPDISEDIDQYDIAEAIVYSYAF